VCVCVSFAQFSVLFSFRIRFSNLVFLDIIISTIKLYLFLYEIRIIHNMDTLLFKSLGLVRLFNV